MLRTIKPHDRGLSRGCPVYTFSKVPRPTAAGWLHPACSASRSQDSSWELVSLPGPSSAAVSQGSSGPLLGTSPCMSAVLSRSSSAGWGLHPSAFACHTDDPRGLLKSERARERARFLRFPGSWVRDAGAWKDHVGFPESSGGGEKAREVGQHRDQALVPEAPGLVLLDAVFRPVCDVGAGRSECHWICDVCVNTERHRQDRSQFGFCFFTLGS